MFYASLLDATRAEGLAEARRDPDAAFAPLKLRAGLRVLDVGCGTGDYLRVMAPLVAPGRAVGVDLSAALVGCAQRRISPGQAHVTFKVGDACRLPFADAAFDRVIAHQVLLHLADPWRAIWEMRRVRSGRAAIHRGVGLGCHVPGPDRPGARPAVHAPALRSDEQRPDRPRAALSAGAPRIRPRRGDPAGAGIARTRRRAPVAHRARYP